jgi:PAS domain S-box-containing protein
MTSGIKAWRSAFQNSTRAIARAELNGWFVETNRAYNKLVGYSAAELREITLCDLVHEGSRPAHEACMAQLSPSERHDFQIETRYRRKDGELIWVRKNVWLIAGTEYLLPRRQHE